MKRGGSLKRKSKLAPGPGPRRPYPILSLANEPGRHAPRPFSEFKKRWREIERAGLGLSKRKPLKKHGARARRAAPALEAFRKAVLERAGGTCEACGLKPAKVEAHHIVNRARGVGWPLLHDAYTNGLGVCRACHESLTKWPRTHPLWQEEWLGISRVFAVFEHWRAKQ